MTIKGKRRGNLSVNLPSVSKALEDGSEVRNAVDEATQPESKSYVAPIRRGRKGILFYVPEAKHHELKKLALENRSSLQDELTAIVDRYLVEHGIDPAKFE
ncbi:MAG: hypothetical protein MH252_14175 [Thermosynechococcaceae cyanobacterium MS004]|nr:hypothetical protein [Thermosynechococcaceae cyanobacterium MS004]